LPTTDDDKLDINLHELDIGTMNDDNNKKVFSPRYEPKPINYWNEYPNPYETKWAKRVLKNHYKMKLKK